MLKQIDKEAQIYDPVSELTGEIMDHLEGHTPNVVVTSLLNSLVRVLASGGDDMRTRFAAHVNVFEMVKLAKRISEGEFQ